MNELWIDMGYGFLYYNTSKTTLPEALEEFINTLDSIGCCCDNFGWQEIELRDGDLNPIEYMGRGTPKDLGV